MSKTRKIAIFGGTFDPIHQGHIHLAELAVDALGLDQVRFVPCWISPHKTDRQPAPAGDRLEMLRLATAALPWAIVDDSEIEREGPSYSFQTAEAMAVEFPGSRLFWIMGADQWDALPRWAEPLRLAKIVEFIVFERGTAPTAREGYRMHSVDGGHPASATVIREALSRGVTTQPWLHPDVSLWIRNHRLYSPG